MKKTINIFFASVLLAAMGYGQTVADSLLAILSNTEADTQQVHLLNDIGWEYMYDDSKKAKDFLQQSIQLSRKIPFPKGEAQAYNNLGVVFAIQGEIDTATLLYQQALGIRQTLGDKKGVASLYNNIGNLYEEKGNYILALENLQQSLKLRQALKDTLRTARVLYNISYVHERMGNYPEALDFVIRHLELLEYLDDDYSRFNAYTLLGNINMELEVYGEALNYYQQSLDIAKDIGDDVELGIAYNNLGNMLDELAESEYKNKQFEKALPRFRQSLDYLKQSLAIRIKTEDREGEGDSHNNIGVVYKNLGSYFFKLNQPDSANIQWQKALYHLNTSLGIQEELGNGKGIIEVYNGMGDVYRRLGKTNKALFYTKKYLDLAHDMNDRKFIQKAYKDLSRAYADKKDFKRAFDFRKKYDEIRYERLSEEQVKQNARRQAIFGDYQVQLENEKQALELERRQAELRQAAIMRNSLIAGALGLTIIALLLYNRYRLKNKANAKLNEKNQIIEAEKKRSDDLLLNILPAQTAQELKANGKAQAKHFDQVTVLFSDIVSFTQIAASLEAAQLVALLDEAFRGFDEIMSRHGVEKIKTIGDAYMCVGGLPVPNATHAADVVKAGLEMQAFMRNFNQKKQAENLPVFQLRIGIHTGPVVAGIVGSTKFAYDIWGDTVNLASRMESSGEAGKVNISAATYALIKGDFDIESRGKVAAKGKGEVEMFFVKGT